MSDLCVALLGSFQATIDGHTLNNFRTSKVQALLIYLLVHAVEKQTQGVGREQIMALLWPDMSRKPAQDNLRQTLYQLRQAIPEAAGPDGDSVPFVLSDRQYVQVNPEAFYQLDVATFAALVQEGGEKQLAAAVELYRGDFLADFYLEDSNEFETWAANRRSLLQRQVLDALDRLAAHHIERGEAREAGAYARRQLEIDNLRESAHRHLMVALSQMGKRAEAIRQYERCCALLQEQLGVTPAAETEAIVAAIRQHGRAGRRAWRLPVPETPLIGREAEVADITSLLGDGARLVTIIGPGGIGKTRLALEVAHRMVSGSNGDQPDEMAPSRRAAFVNLTPIAAAADLVPAVSRALALEFDKGDRHGLKRRLLDYLQGKNLLLLLDNFEHLIDGATLLKEILRAAPTIKLLVTSRERLRLQAEHVYPLTGLGYSEWTTPVEATRDDAVQLFRHHARRLRPSFTLRSEHLQPLQEILQVTGGMPLALILAAGWVQVLDPAEIAAEIGQSVGFLEATHQDVPARQRSMRAVFQATWQRLSAEEQAHFAALSVFRAGFTRSAAHEVAGATPRDLIRLADHSLLTRLPSGRFEIHELLRQFAAERLEESREADAVRDAHSIYYLEALAGRLPDLKSGGQLDAADDIEEDFENVHAAWRWASQRGQWSQLARAGESLHLFSLVRSRYLDGIELLEAAHRAIGQPGSDDKQLPWIYITASWLSLLEEAGLLEEVSDAAHELQAVVDTLAEARAAAYGRLALGGVMRVGGRNEEAIEQLEAALAYYQQVQDNFYVALILWQLSWAKYKSGQGDEAVHLQRQGLALARQAKNPYVTAGLLRSHGAMVWMLEGLTEEAERQQMEAAKLQQEMGEQVAYAYNLSELANMPVWREGDLSRAHAMLDEALAIAESQNVPDLTAHVLAEITTLRLIDGRYEEALALTEKVLDLAFDHLSTWTWAGFQRGIAYLGLGDIDQAARSMKLPLSRMIAEDWSGLLRNLVAFAGVILAERGQEERAAEVLALGLTHPHTPGRLEVDPLISRYRVQLEATLGKERFAAAWERGKQLDTLDVAAEVLEELESAG
jgi:DNA-binding SARP family transcriptional activator/predicted ATPase